MGYVVLAILAVWVIAMLIWIAVATVLRLLSLVLVFWALSATVLFLYGIVVGMWLPFHVLRGKSKTQAVICTPGRVAANQVFSSGAKGQSKFFGWDRAWPNYVPYQAKEDFTAVFAEGSRRLSAAWSKVRGGGTGFPRLGISASALSATARRALPGFFWVILIPIQYAAYWLGVRLSLLVWAVVMLVIGQITRIAQEATSTAIRLYDRWSRKLDGAVAKCPHCYEETLVPSYRCSGHDCTIVHRDLVPGPLGVLHRRCECGAHLRTGVARAASSLQAVCPFCDKELIVGTGTRRTVQVPIVGAVGSGKSRFIAAAIEGLRVRSEAQSATLESPTELGKQLLATSRETVRRREHTMKTPRGDRPQGVPLILRNRGLPPIELQFIDVAGEHFQDMYGTAELRYIDNAPAMLFVFDPLAIPAVAREASNLVYARGAVVAQSDQEESYASIIERLRGDGVRLDRRQLGFVISKCDILLRLGVGRSLKDAASDTIRQWLVDQHLDRFVARAEKDFQSVEYFMVDSMSTTDPTKINHAVHPLEWLCQASRAEIFPDPDAQAWPRTLIESVATGVRNSAQAIARTTGRGQS